MSNTPGLVSSTGSGYTIVTQVIPSSGTVGGPETNTTTISPFQKFLKAEPKALGTVQIMIGLVTFFFGIMISVSSSTVPGYNGVSFWGGLMYISTGSLVVSASNKLSKCTVTGSLVMNVISAIIAGIAIVIFSFHIAFGMHWSCSYRYEYSNCRQSSGIFGFLLALSITQFFISIFLSVFGCKASCSSVPSVNITLAPNHAGNCSLLNPVPAHNKQEWMYPVTGVPAASPPMESLPQYSEIKGQLEN